MRVNVYAEEMTDRLEIVQKDSFTGLRFYLELPVTKEIVRDTHAGAVRDTVQVQGPFIHHPGDDDDSGAVTFWGKRDLRVLLRQALDMLDKHYAKRDA